MFLYFRKNYSLYPSCTWWVWPCLAISWYIFWLLNRLATMLNMFSLHIMCINGFYSIRRHGCWVTTPSQWSNVFYQWSYYPVYLGTYYMVIDAWWIHCTLSRFSLLFRFSSRFCNKVIWYKTGRAAPNISFVGVNARITAGGDSVNHAKCTWCWLC